MSQTDFGDFSDNYQRYGIIPTGGMAIECGCITVATDADATISIVTHFEKCYALILSPGVGTDATDAVEAQPCVSGGYIKAAFSGAVLSGWYNYIAVGN